MSFISLNGVTKRYRTGNVVIEAAKNMTFDIEKGELAVIVGPSGSGKTTILNILGGMDSSDSGTISVDGTDIQFYNLIPNLTARENVELAAQITRDFIPAEIILEKVGLKDRMDNFPAQLSGGEQQRVSIARALSKKPKLLLCDEPTGALDYTTGKMILKLLQDTCREDNMTVIIVTHNSALTAMADKVIHVRSGETVKVVKNETPSPVEEIEW